MSYKEEIEKIKELADGIGAQLDGVNASDLEGSAATAHQSTSQQLTPVRQKLKQLKATLDQFLPSETKPAKKPSRRRTRKPGPSENK